MCLAIVTTTPHSVLQSIKSLHNRQFLAVADYIFALVSGKLNNQSSLSTIETDGDLNYILLSKLPYRFKAGGNNYFALQKVIILKKGSTSILIAIFRIFTSFYHALLARCWVFSINYLQEWQRCTVLFTGQFPNENM